MLRFTTCGAVEAPTALQIRLVSRGRGLVRAGAPTPTRDLSSEEVAANLEHFTTGLTSSRTVPVTELIVSGGWLRPSEVKLARDLGIRRIVAHAPGAEERPGADRVVRVVGQAPLEPEDNAVFLVVLDDLSTLSERLGRVPSSGALVLSWPYPGGRSVAPAVGDTLQALKRCSALLDRPHRITGLPACLLQGLPHADHRVASRRAKNRYYVDAEHQGADALLFFPDVVRFFKPEPCRACVVGIVCDGVALGWFDAGLVPQLLPIVGL